MSTCTCPDCLGCDPLNPAEEARAAERRPAYLRLVPDLVEPVVCLHGRTTLPCESCQP